MSGLWNAPAELRQSFRRLLRAPALPVVIVLILATGIGAATATFHLVQAVLIDPLPFGDPDRLVFVWERRPRQGRESNPVSPADFFDWRSDAESFSVLAAHGFAGFNLTGGGDPERVSGARVTEGYFDVLGVAPLFGRTFSPAEMTSGREDVVVLSHALWQRRFGSDGAVLDRDVVLDGERHRIVGVMPRGIEFPMKRDLWVPLTLEPGEIVRGAHYLHVIGRLRADRTLEDAQSEMDAITSRLQAAHPEVNDGHEARVASLPDELVGEVRPILLRLLGMAGIVLLVAGANAANLWLARTMERARERALCQAMGASPLRLYSHVLAEGLWLSMAAGGLGLLAASLVSRPLLERMLPSLGRPLELSLQPTVVGVTLALCLVSALVLGCAPFASSSSRRLHSSLKDGGRMSGTGGHTVRRALIVVQVALALVCLVGASLTFRSFSRLLDVDTGFRTDGILTARLSLPPSRYSDPGRRTRFFEELLERLRARPGITSVGATSILPLSGEEAGRFFTVEGRPRTPGDVAPNARIRIVSPEYFRTLSIPVLRGRDFTERDRRGSGGVAIVNDTLSRRYWPDENVLGKAIRFGDRDGDRYEVVGVVGDVRHETPDHDPNGQLYLPFLQEEPDSLSLVLRSSGDPLALVGLLREDVWAVDPELPLADVETMDAMRRRSLASPRELRTVFALFAVLATALAAGGLYALIAYVVARRSHEMAVRMVLGASLADVLGLVFRQGMSLVSAGIVVALGAVVHVGTWLESLLFEVSPFDPPSLVASALLLCASGALAILLGSYRATRVRPADALRPD